MARAHDRSLFADRRGRGVARGAARGAARGIERACCALALSACASSSIGSDLSRVRELSEARELPALGAARGAGGHDQELRALLRAPIDADSAVRLALLHNRELRAQLHELGIARGELMQAGQVANPVVGAEAIPAAPTEVELRVEYDISSLLLAPLRAGAAEAALDAARHRAAAAVVRLGYEVRAAFAAVQASERKLGIAAQALEAFALGREAANALLEAGNARVLDAASQIVAHERARVRLAEIDLELSERRERLQRLLGVEAQPGEPALRVRPGPDAAPETLSLPNDLEQRAVAKSLELAETRNQMSAAEQRADAARTEGWLPELHVGALGVYEEHTPAEEEAGGEGDPWRLGAGINVAAVGGGEPGPFGYIDMGGMFTVLKVREDPDRVDPNAWYEHPAGTVASAADAGRMRADGVDPAAPPRRKGGGEHG